MHRVLRLIVGISHLTRPPLAGFFAGMVAILKDSHFERVANIIRPDGKKRITLGSVFDSDEEASTAGFVVYKNAVGQVILDPVAVIPASELWLFKNKKALAAVRKGLKQSAEGKTVYLGSFAEKYGNVE